MLHTVRTRHRKRRSLSRPPAGASALVQLNVCMSTLGGGRRNMWKRVCWMPQNVASRIPTQGCIYVPNLADRKSLADLCEHSGVDMMPMISSGHDNENARQPIFRLQMDNINPPQILMDKEVCSMTLCHIESKDSPTPKTPPAIHNVCGKFRTSYSPTLADRVAAIMVAENHDALVYAHDNFARGHYLHTRHGNAVITLARPDSCISFKGVRDTEMFLSTARVILGEQTWLELQPLPDPEVHMVVTSLSVGRKIDIIPGSLLIQNMLQLTGEGSIREMPINDEDLNTAAFVVTGWARIYESMGWNRFQSAADNPCKASVTASNRGSIIIRMSWEHPIIWNRSSQEALMQDARAIGHLVWMCS